MAPFVAIAFLFVVSGLTGLLYEVAFSKLLSTVFGATAYAVSAVLASFMGGLALGAHLGGRFADRVRRPLALYGVMEILVGGFCLLSPALLDLVTRAYVHVASQSPDSLALATTLRVGLTFGCIVLPTIAMGATLPALARVVVTERGAHAERRLSWLYGCNTFGGALGALLSAYAALPWLGVRGAMTAAAAANGILGVVAIALAYRADPLPDTSVATRPRTATGSDKAGQAVRGTLPPKAAVLAFASGFLVFAVEVVDTHLLSLLIGNGAYAFGLMLFAFLVCLAVGSTLAPRMRARFGEAALAVGLSASALTLVLFSALWDDTSVAFAFFGKHVTSWAGRELCRAAVAMGLLFVPTVLMGTTFPLLLTQGADREGIARHVGRLTTTNTLGTIAGAVITGYIILPYFGSQRSIYLVGVCLVALAAWVCPVRAPRRHRLGPAAMSLLSLGAIVTLAPWDLAKLTNGANVYFTFGPPPDRIDFVEEDVHGGVTTVVARDGVKTLLTNGKFQGDDGPEMVAQRRFAHYPSLFVDSYDRALVIGLGTGTTLGTVTAYPFQAIDVAEISPAIIAAAREHFEGPNRGSLADPRVTMHENDGRNVILIATQPYDLVTIELTSVWFAGASSLYSEEFYRLVQSKMTPGGVLQQWVQLHHIEPKNVAVIMATLASVFPHVALFEGGGQGILVASDEPLQASRARLDTLSSDPAIVATLGGRTLPSLVDDILLSGPELEQFAAEHRGSAPHSTDDNLYLEYATPKGNVMNYDSSLAATKRLLEAHRTRDPKERHLVP